MDKYDFKKIETKWQKIWDEDKNLYHGVDDSSKEKHYHLVEFPYPSGAGLHIGHCMGYGASDAYCRMKRMQGKNVMFPIGWDAFGLPTENFAIKTGRKPAEVTKENTDVFRRQMKSLGLSFDWEREINTTDPNYYHWTQWIFLQFYKHAIVDGKLVQVADDDTTTPRLAYQAEMAINWCPSCKIGLANEEVVAGKCERCGADVVKKMQKQWMLRITAYADRLIKDLDTTDYLEKIKTQQINWIGKSTGTNIQFRVIVSDSASVIPAEAGIQKNTILPFGSEARAPHRSGSNEDPRVKPEDDKVESIEVFTTRADTLFGCTYVVLAPEHPLLLNLKSKISNSEEVEKYIDSAKKKSDMERTELAKEKTGVKLEGIKAINPINNKEVDIYVADYVLANYGTGAVMAVPAHDERDWEFAKKYDIPIIEVIMPVYGNKHENEERRNTVTAIVPNKDGSKFLMINWKEFGWYSPVAGGVDEGEDFKEAVEREVFEETGYKVKAVEKIGGEIKMHFFAENKKVWRERYDQPVLCELLDEKRQEVSEEENKRHEPLWMTLKEIYEKTTHSENAIGFQRFEKKNYSFCDYGYLINSGEYDGLSSEDAKKKITEKLNSIGSGDFTVNFKLRDWIFSRQHYWGEPIPIVYCAQCAKTFGKKQETRNNNQNKVNFAIIDGEEHMIVPVPEEDLPVKLPDVENYQPTNTGESPLADISEWVNVKCPKCGGNAKRETDTMPNWAGSSWYFLRYCDPACNTQLAMSDKLKYWMPVDLYNGGMEHTTLHLLYSRFWNKFLFDLGTVPTSEPYQKRIAHGIILGADGRKMSKSFGNVINPDDIVKQYGADATRAYIMFIGPYDTESAWSMAGVAGVSRFLNRVFKNFTKAKKGHADSKELILKLNQTIAGITDDLENFRLNTVVSKLMELNNLIEKSEGISFESYEKFIQLLFPVAPHLASELWNLIGKTENIDYSNWPLADKNFLIGEEIEVVVQINGKVRDKLKVPFNISDEDLKAAAFNSEKVKSNLEAKEIVKTIVVPKKLVSIVVK